MIQSRNGQSQSEPEQTKPKGRYTGERLLRERPRVYRKVVELLAEPREQMSIRRICRSCHVTDDTVKAVEKRETIPIAARKQALLSIATNVAQVAAERMEELAGQASLREASVTFGIATEKLLLLSGDPTLHIAHSFEPVDLCKRLNEFCDAINAKYKQTQGSMGKLPSPQLALPNRETISDSDAETGLETEEKTLKKIRA
jgi:hypothetical protein